MQKQMWFGVFRRWRFPLSALLDSALWLGALYVAALARLSFEPGAIDISNFFGVGLIAIGTQLVGGVAMGLYKGKHAIASYGEVMLVVASSVVAGAVATAAVVLAGPPSLLPVSAVLAATAYQLLGSLGIRYAARFIVEVTGRSGHPREHRAIIFGAGEAGHQIVQALQRDPEADTVAVALLDDDATKANRRIQGLRVVGGLDDIEAASQRFDADVLLIAMPAAPRSVLVDVADRGQAAGLTVRVLPRLSQIVEHGVRVRDIRDIALADFLERDEVQIDLEQIASYLEGKRVLVTGAGGSIGSELCETIARFNPARLLLLDHSENNLHRVWLRMGGSASIDPSDLVLADIRDVSALQTVFERECPQVVFHAAAHKHVPFLEAYPEEAIKTNVHGTLNVLVAAVEADVERFVNISTDKAADPVNMLGVTKRIGERFTAHFAPLASGVFMSVRFGNVLGSDGSVIPTFREQLMQGRPLTVTDPDATRFFMTIPEAVQLVLEAGAVGGDGNVLVLDMGEPVKVVDLAHRISAELRPGVPVNIEVVGLRPGEKLHEVLFSANDTTVDKPHERLWRCDVPPLSPIILDGPVTRDDLVQIVNAPAALASEDL